MKAPTPMAITVKGFIDPRWWTSRPPFITAYAINNEFNNDGHTLFLVEDSVPDGTELFVNLHTFRAYVKEERERYDEWRENMAAHKKTVDNFKLALQRLKSERFNAKLGISFRWKPAIKEVLSGLGANSMGNGTYRNTVIHIMVDQTFLKRGRFKRGRGEYLCKQTKGRFTGVDPHEYWYDDAGNKYPAMVTCQVCIDRAKKIDQAVQYKLLFPPGLDVGNTQ